MIVATASKKKTRKMSADRRRAGENKRNEKKPLTKNASREPGLKDALLHITSIVDDQPPESGQSTQETLDLISHLHGILTANLPVPMVPNLRGQFTPQKEDTNTKTAVTGSGKGYINSAIDHGDCRRDCRVD